MNTPGFLTPPLRQDAESSLAGSASDGAPANMSLLYELQVHQIELEMQNEALRQAQVDLADSRDRYARRYADLYDFAPVAYLSLSASGAILEANHSCAALLGVDREKLPYFRFDHFVVNGDLERWQQLFMRLMAKKGCRCLDLELKHSGGSTALVHVDWQWLEGEGLRLALTDLSERRQAEEEQRIAAMAFESQEAMMVTDAEGRMLRVNRAFTKLTGYGPEEAIGRTPALLSSGRNDKAFYQRMWQVLKDSGYWQGEMWNRRKNGKIFAEWLNISAVTGADGLTSHYVGTFSEITQNKEAEAEIHRLAYYDSLTHLPNRRLLHDRMGQAMAAGKRSGRYGTLLFLDLDNFKVLNDTRGHAAGDQLLIDTARRIQAQVREGDTVARLGGDEFVIMLEDLSTEAQEAAIEAGLVGEKIRESLARPCDLAGRPFYGGASLGAVLFRGHEESVEALLKYADMAMYKAKSAGRNVLRFFDPAMQVALEERSALEADLRLALERGELQLYYQPQMDDSRRITGAEALLRWQHPQRGMVSPLDFISLAEDTGLILPIGLWVLETACALLKTWSLDGATGDLRLAVNVSARQFRQPDFAEQVMEVLARSGAEPTRLKIELTESIVIDDVDEVISRMQTLKALGIGFSMDDFGTGFSSLSYLKRLPLDQLKIDRAFVSDLASDPNDGVIARTIITMGKTLGLDVIAEGVETEDQLACLRTFGCQAFQGYLFSRPLPLAAFEEMLRRQGGDRVLPAG